MMFHPNWMTLVTVVKLVFVFISFSRIYILGEKLL